MEEDTVATLVIALAAYVRAHPAAADSVSGIAQWWLSSEEFVAQRDVEQALKILVDRQVMEEVVAADGRRRYRRIGSDADLEAAVAAIARGRA